MITFKISTKSCLELILQKVLISRYCLQIDQSISIKGLKVRESRCWVMQYQEQLRLRANAPSLSLSPPYLYSCIVAPRPPCFITRMSTQSLNSRYMNQERVNKVHSLSARVFLEQIRANMSQRCCLAGISD